MKATTVLKLVLFLYSIGMMMGHYSAGAVCGTDWHSVNVLFTWRRNWNPWR